MADEEVTPEDAEAPKSGKKKLLLIGVGVLLLAAGGFAGMTFFGGSDAAEGEGEIAEAEPTAGPPIYTSLHPPLVVNFKDQAGDAHFMQVTMEVMTRDQDVANAVREHTPVIRNSLILHYSGAVYEEVTTREGKEKMLAEGLEEIQKIMTSEVGEVGVEAVYFTALIIQ